MMKNKLFSLILVCIIGVGAVGLHNILENADGDGLWQKPIWADLQEIEFQNRKDLISKLVFLKGAADSGKYDVLGIPTANKDFPHVWIVLNTHIGSSGKIYIIQQHDEFTLSCSYIAELDKTTQLDFTVRQFLQKHCGNGSSSP